jgi:hypothetical protein
MIVLRPLRGLVIIDEIQRRPELFPALRVLADRPRTPAPGSDPRTHRAQFALDALDIVHAGSDSFPLAERVRALALRRIIDDLKPLR